MPLNARSGHDLQCGAIGMVSKSPCGVYGRALYNARSGQGAVHKFRHAWWEEGR